MVDLKVFLCELIMHKKRIDVKLAESVIKTTFVGCLWLLGWCRDAELQTHRKNGEYGGWSACGYPQKNGVDRWKCFEIETSFCVWKCLWVVTQKRHETHFSKRLAVSDGCGWCFQMLSKSKVISGGRGSWKSLKRV